MFLCSDTGGHSNRMTEFKISSTVLPLILVLVEAESGIAFISGEFLGVGGVGISGIGLSWVDEEGSKLGDSEILGIDSWTFQH